MTRTPRTYTGLTCTECGTSFPDQALGRCPKCSGLLDTTLSQDALAEYSRHAFGSDQSMWRFRMFLPVFPESSIITAGEGGTPLRKLRPYPPSVLVKDETRNPTAAFKDRGASLAITCLTRLKVHRVVLASEGNAGCSFALYSQMAQIRCKIYLPKQANPEKVRLSGTLGATITPVSGTIGDAGQHAANHARKTGYYNASSFVTPFRHDGKGTIALEICEQLGWKAPDFVVYPVGGGVGLVGMWKMFKILKSLGWIRITPRIIAVQPAGCAPVVEAYNHRLSDVEEWRSPRTIAQGLKIPKPLAGRWILRCLTESNAIGLRVTDREIRLAMQEAVKRNGLILEPSSAAAFAALPKIYETGEVDRKDQVVIIATGSGLKTLE